MGKKSVALTISIVLVFLSFLYIFFTVVQNRSLYTTHFDPKLFEKKFNQSQWVIPNSKKIISDEDLYAYSGYQYVKGKNPILINPEVPPLGKYIIGVSILIFNNQRIASILAGVLSLGIIFLLLYLSTRSLFISSLGLFLSSITSLFIDQLIHAPQLDIFQLFFLLSTFYFFLLYLKKKSLVYMLLSGISAGAFVSTKIFVVSFFLINSTLFLFYLMRRISIKKVAIEMVLLNVVTLLVYLITYAGYFVNGGTLRGFFGVQKWIFLFYNDSQIDKIKLLGSYIGLILLNRWKYWSAGYPIISYESWAIIWPLIFLLGGISTFMLVKKKNGLKDNLVLIFTVFLIVYNGFLFITPIYPRYLLLLFIPLNMLTVLYLGPKIEALFQKYF